MKHIYIIFLILLIGSISCNNQQFKKNVQFKDKHLGKEFDLDHFLNQIKKCNKIVAYSSCAYVDEKYNLYTNCNYNVGLGSKTIINNPNYSDTITDKKTVKLIVKELFEGKNDYNEINGSDLRIVLVLVGTDYYNVIGLNENSVILNDEILIKTKFNPLEIVLKNSPTTFRIFDDQYKSFIILDK